MAKCAPSTSLLRTLAYAETGYRLKIVPLVSQNQAENMITVWFVPDGCQCVLLKPGRPDQQTT
jgi:hypothetical protein